MNTPKNMELKNMAKTDQTVNIFHDHIKDYSCFKL
jgi:hypothetical protein